MSLNMKITYYMCFQQKKIKPDISLKIHGEIIAEVTSSNFFGALLSTINQNGETMFHLYAQKLLVTYAL